MQSECPDIGPVYQAFKKDPKNRPDKEEIHANSDATRFYFSDWNRLEMHNDVLYRIWEAPNGVHRCDQLLVPRSFSTTPVIHTSPQHSRTTRNEPGAMQL